MMLVLLAKLLGGSPTLPPVQVIASRPLTRTIAEVAPAPDAPPAPHPAPAPTTPRRVKPSEHGQGVLNALLSPGPLIRGHQNLENDCLKCHTPAKGVPDSKCLECHKEIRADVLAHQGFHGLTHETCIQCHKDHKGRNFDSTRIDPRTFNHKLTGFPLQGKHAEIECTDCHTQRRDEGGRDVVHPNGVRYFGLSPRCVSCHKKDDVHHFPGKWAREDCNACHHSARSWTTDTHFDHAKETHYALEGKHAELKCAACHQPNPTAPPIYVWSNLKEDQCLACHKDHHDGNLSPRFQGGDCTQCHSQNHWQIRDFDHTVTGFKLQGRHAEITCVACHRQKSAAVAHAGLKSPAFSFTGLSRDCVSCHKDYHQFGNQTSDILGPLNQCQICHGERSWKPAPKFDHNTDTRFPIIGKHLGVQCFKCHVRDSSNAKVRIYHWERLNTKTCEICHESPHTHTFPPQLLAKKCTDCHTALGWKVFPKKTGKFNHDTSTRFPLTGKHRKLSCAACHLSGKNEKFKFENSDKEFCVDCHKNIHVGQFDSKFAGEACSQCHTAVNFTRLKAFDHSTTAFPLTGSHVGLRCNWCHTETNHFLDTQPPRRASKFLFKNKDKQFCSDCHDNVHVGQFKAPFVNEACSDCHTTVDFVHRLPFNHNSTGFELKGQHATLQCSACHVSTHVSFPERPGHVKHQFLFPGVSQQDCVACHRDPHEGKNGPSCTACHTEQDWHQIQNFHRNFMLTGIHTQVSCDKCHTDWRPLTGMSRTCILCHQRDDVHNHTLPRCEKCHTQQFWEVTTFKHSMTYFPLRGYHRTLDCNACHAEGIYMGTPYRCVDCHRAQALSFTGNPNHQLLLNTDCSECHNQFSFQ